MKFPLYFIAAVVIISNTMFVAGTKCQDEVAAAGPNPMPGQFVPQCDVYGNFISPQCSGSTGYCYCVNTITGAHTGASAGPGKPLACNR